MSSGAGGPLTAGSLSSQAGVGNADSPYTGLPQQTVVDNPFLTATSSVMPNMDGGGGGGGDASGGGINMTDELMRLRQGQGIGGAY